MLEVQLTKANIQQVIDSLQDELESHPVLIVTAKSGDTGSVSMLRIWRTWMSSVARFMASNGVTMPLMINAKGESYGKRDFNADDAHALFTSQLLGVDIDGKRLSWSSTGRDGMRSATKSERLHAMASMQVWAAERGINLAAPRDSEYSRLKDEQNG